MPDLEFRVDPKQPTYTFIYRPDVPLNCGVIAEHVFTVNDRMVCDYTLVMSWTIPGTLADLHTVTVPHLSYESAKDVARAMSVLEYRVF